MVYVATINTHWGAKVRKHCDPLHPKLLRVLVLGIGIWDYPTVYRFYALFSIHVQDHLCTTYTRARAWANLRSYMLSLDNGNGPRMRIIGGSG